MLFVGELIKYEDKNMYTTTTDVRYFENGETDNTQEFLKEKKERKILHDYLTGRRGIE
jgi:hypothetical protein